MSIKKIIKYRTYWMGAAILWVIFFHSAINCDGVIGMIKAFGYGGVDIFLFSSGIGNYYSYLRDCNPLDFLKRRILRLAPSWIPFITVWIVVKIIFSQFSPFSIVGNIFAIQGFTSNGDAFNWYLTSIILCYLLTPYLATYVREHSQKKNCIIIIFLLVISSAFWKDSRMIISMARLPIYCIGMVFAKNDDKQLSMKQLGFMFLLFLIGLGQLFVFSKYFEGMLWNYALYWYPFILIAPFLCVVMSMTINYIENKRIISKICSPILSTLRITGRCSFEIFMIHIFFFDIESSLCEKYQFQQITLLSIGVALLSILTAIGYNKLIYFMKNGTNGGNMERQHGRPQ